MFSCLFSVIFLCLVLSDNDVYAKKTLYTFAAIPTESTLWEKISLCSDVMEGVWYLLYDDQKKPSRPEKIKKLIRQSIDNFHNKLVSDSKICISLAVFGPLGAGKSFLLNFVLNQGLPEMYQGKSGPLPSAFGGSQTPLPINIKWGSKVQVLLHKQEKSASPDVWFPEEELGVGTLARVNKLLEMKFKDAGNLSGAKCVELQGPFPVFRVFKERSMTTCGHLELEVDVEFVDIPGRGDETGNQSIDTELSNADVVLFFQEGQSGRPVSSEDIAQIFRRLEEVQFTSRPKLVHVLNDRRKPSSVSSCDFGLLQEQKREDLNRAWSSFLSSSIEQGTRPGCYKDVIEKLPQLNGEAVLDKLSKESDVIYFHPENSDFLVSLKNVINDHVQNVKIKETIHPFLKNVHWAAKKLRTRIGRSLTTEKKKNQPGKIEVKVPNFEMQLDVDQVSNLVESFIDQQRLPLQPDIRQMYCFLNSEETLAVLLDSLKVSLETFRLRLIEHFKNAYWSTSPDISDLVDLVEILCESRVQQYCANSAQTYLLHVVEKEKNRNPLKKYEKHWSGAGPKEKTELCVQFLVYLLERIAVSLNKPTRDRKKEDKKSHFHLVEQLKEDVKDLFAVGSLENASRPEQLKVLNKKLQIVIEFCTTSIREINPHPSLDVETDISLPEEMKDVHESKAVPLRSSYDAIIKDVTELLKKPGTKGSDAIRKLESKLSVGKGALVLREPQSAEKQRLWAKALVNVLSDKNHFDIQLDPSLTLEPRDPEVEKFLKQARKRLFAHEKSSITCKIVTGQALPDDEIHIKKRSQEGFCLEVLVSSEMSKKLDAIRNGLVDPMQQIAPIFMPTIRPGPSREIRGNFFLEEDPWSKEVHTDDLEDKQSETVKEAVAEENRSNVLNLNIFLVVEEQHLKTVQSTVNDLKVPTGRNMTYVVLPQKGRGIGVTRAIIKSLAECLKFPLYWTTDDDVQFMYQFDENDRKWHKCSLARGLLFGQRVFQTCLKKTVKELSDEEKFALVNDMMQKCPSYGSKAKQSAMFLLIDGKQFAAALKNPGLLHSPFTHTSEDCGGDTAKEEEMKAFEQEFVQKCRKLLFDDTINHIAGISIAHESTKKYDYMSKYPTADYMQSEQRYQVVLHNTSALKGMNFVTDDIIFHEDEDHIKDINKRNTPYWGIRGSDKSFCRALTVGGVIGYQVIRVVHSHKKLINVFDRVGPSYLGSQSPYRSEHEDEDDEDVK